MKKFLIIAAALFLTGTTLADVTDEKRGYFTEDGVMKFYSDYVNSEYPLIVTGADIKSFKSLPYWYAKDDKNVYYMAELVTGADPKTFKFLEDDEYNYFPVDKNHVYYAGKIFKGEDSGTGKWEADVKTFKVVGPFIAIDSKYIYTPATKLPNSDSATLQKIGGEYWKDKNNIYVEIAAGEIGYMKILEGADINSFKYLGINEYAKDKNHVYKWFSPITGYDAATFTVIAYYNGKTYSFDKNHIYENLKIMEGKSPKVFLDYFKIKF